jgi:hypothetical protein
MTAFSPISMFSRYQILAVAKMHIFAPARAPKRRTSLQLQGQRDHKALRIAKFGEPERLPISAADRVPH